MKGLIGADGRTIGQRIGFIREEKKFTQQSLADSLGVPRSNVRNWENDGRELKPEMIVSLAKVLDVSTDYLLGVSDNPTRDESIDGACRCTGLSLGAVKRIQSLKENDGKADRVSSILEAEQFPRLIEYLDDAAFSCEQVQDAVNFLLELGEPLPEASYKQGPDGNMELISGDPILQSRMYNAELDLKEHLPKLRIQLFEISELWPELLESIMPAKETIRAGKDLCKKFDIR